MKGTIEDLTNASPYSKSTTEEIGLYVDTLYMRLLCRLDIFRSWVQDLYLPLQGIIL